MSVVVVKVGGSLLDLPDLGDRLRSFLRSVVDGEHQPLFVVGGGRLTDVVRDWDCIHRLGDEAAHQLAMQTLAVNESLIELLMVSTRAKNRDEATSAWAAGRIPILDTAVFVAAEENHNRSIAPLPHTWSVTSDSLAAWVAATWPASKLVLLKSTDAPADVSIDEWSSRGLVDEYFPMLIPRVPQIEWMNLRSERAQVVH